MRALETLNLFEPSATWDAARQICCAIDGIPPTNPELWRTISGGRDPLTEQPTELFVAAGRGAGKSELAAIVAASFATRKYARRWLSPRTFIVLVAPNQRQAAETLQYLSQIFSHAQLAPLVTGRTQTSIDLKNHVRIESLPADPRTVRSRSCALAIIEEAAFLDKDASSARPDTELIRALRPALGRVPGSMLMVVSSKYDQKGCLFEASKHFGQPGEVLYVEGSTKIFNPTFDQRVIDTAYRTDPIAAASEYGTSWRTDVTGFVTREALLAVTIAGRVELLPQPGITYRAFLDFAGGSGGDSATCAIAHTNPTTKKEILDAVREIRPPFSPDQACIDFAAFIKSYGLSSAKADRWGGSFPSERMSQYGVTITPVGESKSELYGQLLPLINSGMIELLDLERLTQQTLGLERFTSRGGGSAIDHAPRAHDDVINAAAGALVVGRPAAGVQYRVSCFGVYEPRLLEREAAARSAEQAELEQLLPAAVRVSTQHTLAFLIDQNPTCTMRELYTLWEELAARGLLVNWNLIIQRQAESLLQRRAA